MEGHLQRVLGDNVRAFRRAKGLSQEGLADFLGVHRTYVGAIERGDKNLSLKSIERLAGRLGVPPLQLLGATGPALPPSDPGGEAKGEAAGGSGDGTAA